MQNLKDEIENCLIHKQKVKHDESLVASQLFLMK